MNWKKSGMQKRESRAKKYDYCTLLGFLVKLTLGSNRVRQEWEYSYVLAVKT
jgi:hypothetical protein